MPSEVDLTIFAKDYPEARLIAEVKRAVSTPPQEDGAVRRMARYMWGANCHYGLVITPAMTYVLRDDFSTSSPEAIHITEAFPTAKLFSRLGRSGVQELNAEQLQSLAREWLQRLTVSYEAALPDDPDVMRAFFPDLVGAVAEGRVVTQVAA